jgi:hypothetical protein
MTFPKITLPGEIEEVVQPQEVVAPTPEPVADLLPEKFKGKSAVEIAQSYQELEKKLGEMGNRLSAKEQEAERQAAAYRDAQAAQAPKEKRATEILDEKWEEDPQAAIRESVHKIEREIETRQAREASERQFNDMVQYATHLYNSNDDFKQLSDTGVLATIGERYAKRFAGDPNAGRYLHSREMVDTIYAVARAENHAKYVQAEVEKQMKLVAARQHQRDTVGGESPGASGNESRPFSSLSLAEQRAWLANRK